MKWNCRNCGAENQGEHTFCIHCGNRNSMKSSQITKTNLRNNGHAEQVGKRTLVGVITCICIVALLGILLWKWQMNPSESTEGLYDTWKAYRPNIDLDMSQYGYSQSVNYPSAQIDGVPIGEMGAWYVNSGGAQNGNDFLLLILADTTHSTSESMTTEQLADPNVQMDVRLIGSELMKMETPIWEDDEFQYTSEIWIELYHWSGEMQKNGVKEDIEVLILIHGSTEGEDWNDIIVFQNGRAVEMYTTIPPDTTIPVTEPISAWSTPDKSTTFSQVITPTPGLPVIISTGNRYGDYQVDVYSNETCVITDYYGTSTKLTIPSEIEGYIVVGIGDNAFEVSKSLVHLEIPSGVTSIGRSAFRACTSLRSVTLPSTLVTIGDNAFETCESLASITIPYGVKSIGHEAFVWCESLAYVKIADSVESIGDFAFGVCFSLVEVTLPNSVIQLGMNPFACCWKLERINVSASNPAFTAIDGVLFDRSGQRLISYPCGNMATRYTIPYGVRDIDDYSIFYCDYLQKVTVPNSVIRIGNNVFQSCYNLNSVTVPASVTEIGDEAFTLCSGLLVYVVPNSYAAKYTIENSIKYAYQN